MKPNFGSQFFRFCINGGVNVIVTLLFYEALLLFFSYKYAYSLQYLIGILIAWLLNSKFTFKSNLSLFRLFLFSVSYALSFIIGLAFLILAINFTGISEKAAPFVIIPIMIPVNFIFSKIALELITQKTDKQDT